MIMVGVEVHNLVCYDVSGMFVGVVDDALNLMIRA
jgi:hypothetical protein